MTRVLLSSIIFIVSRDQNKHTNPLGTVDLMMDEEPSDHLYKNEVMRLQSDEGRVYICRDFMLKYGGYLSTPAKPSPRGPLLILCHSPNIAPHHRYAKNALWTKIGTRGDAEGPGVSPKQAAQYLIKAREK
jgi:hypothetical protein